MTSTNGDSGIVVLTLTHRRYSKLVVTGQVSVTLEWKNTPRKNKS